MDVAIAGGRGKIALHLTRLLAERGDGVRGLVRRDGQFDDVAAAGGRPVRFDLESQTTAELAEAIVGADAAVFAAGAGPGSGPERKETVDYGGAVKLVEAAEAAGVDRFLIVSSMGAAAPPSGDEVFSIYLRAKARADEAVMASGLVWTVVRPGRLTDDPATGAVTLASSVSRGEIPRADVAAVLVAALDEPRTAGHVFEVVGGGMPIGDAVEALVG